VAEEYDKEFTKKHVKDLNTTLVFVSFVSSFGVHTLTGSQAGLLSVLTSAFIIEVNSQLKPDPNDATAALLRVLIHKIDNTTFGDDPSTLPQWTGPPRRIVHVQAILFMSLGASLLSAFLALLGKHWLNRYASTDMRGTAIERSQNRQQKLDGIATWYFDHVMESPLLMLQAGLLLLSCALTHYFWQINITVASIVLGMTLLGVAFYICIVVAGAASESCPYQTPGSQALLYLRQKAQSTLRSAASTITPPPRKSKAFRDVAETTRYYHPWWSWYNIIPFLIHVVLEIPLGLVINAYRLRRVQTLFGFPAGAYRLGSALVRSLASVAHWLCGTPSTPEQRPGYRTMALDLRCISWILQTSLDKAVHLPALKHLATITALADSDPTLVADCFNIFIGCIKVDLNDHTVTIVQGLEELAAVSSLCFFNTVCNLSIMDPKSKVLKDVRQRYTRVLPPRVDIHGHPFYHTMTAACGLFLYGQEYRVQWSNYNPPSHEPTTLAHFLTELAQFRYRGTRRERVPRWILRFALHSLALGSLPPTSVVANCLSIVAIDLGCDVPNMTLDERSVHILQIAITLTLSQCTGEASCKSDSAETQIDY
jgi:hypothetical protein